MSLRELKVTLAAGLIFGMGSMARAQSLVFTDQTNAAGVATTHFHDPDSGAQVMGAGGAAGDFNRDGWQDLFVRAGYSAGPTPPRDRLYINNRNGTFSEQAASWGVDRSSRGLGIAVGDFDNDGWVDVFVTVEPGTGGSNTNALYRNNGNGTFTDVAAAVGIAFAPGQTVGGGWGAAWGDYDLDGNLDLAVSDWLNPASGNVLWRNNGNGTFTNVTAPAIGSALVGSQGFSPRFADMNGDRFPELLWTSDFHASRYLVNNGNGTFSNQTTASGTGIDGNGMGTSVGDFNGDGRPDWFVTSIYSPTPQQNQPGTGNMLYMNLGSHQFAEVSAAAGVKQGGWGWGSVAADLDNDGMQDLAHTNGWPDPEFDADQTCVFRNLGTPAVQFASVAPACGVTHTGQGRGMLNFDYDNDGDQDLVIFTNDGPLTLYRNDLTPPTAAATHWLRAFISTRGTPGLAPGGYGAHITTRVGTTTRHQWITGGSNFLSQSELSAHFGLGAATIVDELRVNWADGTSSVWNNVAADRNIMLRSCRADVNDDGTAGVQDLFDFLAGYFSNNADFNLSGATTVQDIFDFLAAWFSGCA